MKNVSTAVRLTLTVSLAPITVVAEEFEGLAPGPGQEEVFYACSACHSTRIVQQQGLDRDRWSKMLVWMVEEQGMAELDEPERSLILDYLTSEYGPDRKNWR